MGVAGSRDASSARPHCTPVSEAPATVKGLGFTNSLFHIEVKIRVPRPSGENLRPRGLRG